MPGSRRSRAGGAAGQQGVDVAVLRHALARGGRAGVVGQAIALHQDDLAEPLGQDPRRQQAGDAAADDDGPLTP